MSKYKATLEKLKQDIKYYGRLIFLSLGFFVGVLLGDYLNFNVSNVVIITSFLFGCLMVVIVLIDVLTKDDEK